ncbi:MAG: hypothetical protein IT457_11790 [Planctomycetes bacterium]|nr:hypothetical protein [Planctomycetota bacterium]
MEFQPESDEFMEEEVWGEGELVFSEEEIEQLASELLAVSNEGELDHFLGGLIKKAGRALGKFVKSPVGRQLGGLLKGFAKKALPIAGSALGNFIAPGIGGAIGGKLASAAGSAFGLETEGLSEEDQQFEIAKQFVRLAGDATKTAVSAPAAANPMAVARQAMARAIQRHAPGHASGPAPAASGQQSGRWVRRGNRIVLYGV